MKADIILESVMGSPNRKFLLCASCRTNASFSSSNTRVQLRQFEGHYFHWPVTQAGGRPFKKLKAKNCEAVARFDLQNRRLYQFLHASACPTACKQGMR